MGHLKVFGCIAYAKDLGQLQKLDDRDKLGVFIGYTEGLRYRILDPVTQWVKVSRDVVFDEGRGWDWSTPSAGSEFTVEFWTSGDQEGDVWRSRRGTGCFLASKSSSGGVRAE